MDVRTFRAKSMQDALRRVRDELGPGAAVLHTREVRGGNLWRWLVGLKQIEVTASSNVNVPSRFPEDIDVIEDNFADENFGEGDFAGEDHVDGGYAAENYAPENYAAENYATENYATESPDQNIFHRSDFDRRTDNYLSGAESQNRIVRPATEFNRFNDPKEDANDALSETVAYEEYYKRTDPPIIENGYGAKFRDDLKSGMTELHSMVEDLCNQPTSRTRDLPESLFHLYTDLIDAEVSEELAREMIDRVRGGCNGFELDDAVLLKARIARMIEDELLVCGPIKVTPGRCRLVSLVGPTGVGKTTTIAKLAANFRLREQLKVGLITVDTYRIAAVEQLRTYADIIDLPMEIVSTPREMREAVRRLSDLDLVLMDTAGRSPRDEVKIQELQTMLGEAQADEVHLVLSSVSSLASMKKAAERFAQVGATSLILTKLDEATGLGNILPLMRSCRLPMSYVTNGQNVPDDIEAADRRKLARTVLGINERTA
ncbi:MAG: flagellar biosynthesis protein FlhF [Pirellulaceae bacterium]|jgi:flagellar biosynthesis protein FlhF